MVDAGYKFFKLCWFFIVTFTSIQYYYFCLRNCLIEKIINMYPSSVPKCNINLNASIFLSFFNLLKISNSLLVNIVTRQIEFFSIRVENFLNKNLTLLFFLFPRINLEYLIWDSIILNYVLIVFGNKFHWTIQN